MDGRIYINDLLGQRDWYANVRADPECVFHLKQTTRVDLPARARLVTDPSDAGAGWASCRPDRASSRLDAWVDARPIIEVQFPDA